MNTPREYSLAILMAEDGDGIRTPVGIVASRAEADEILVGDMARRRSALEADGDPGICPWEYQIWEHRRDGYEIAERWLA